VSPSNEPPNVVYRSSSSTSATTPLGKCSVIARSLLSLRRSFVSLSRRSVTALKYTEIPVSEG